MDRIGGLIIITLLAMCVIYWWSNTESQQSRSESETTEGMAPLNTGTFNSGVQYGRCNKGSFKRTSCSVGNCPIGTTITDDRFCGIQCAQEVTEEDRDRCHARCMDMMGSGCQ